LNFGRRRHQDYIRTFESETGKRVIADLMKRHFVFGSTQVQGDSHESAFNEGRRAVILDIMSAIGTAPEEAQDILEGKDAYD
jgi:hypothetical protein